MSAPTDIMSQNYSRIRATNAVGAWFKTFFAKLYIAIDKSQRKRAAELIQRYSHLLPNADDKTDERN